MGSKTENVNILYCLARVDGKFRVCRFSSQNILFVSESGEITRVCKRKDLTQWKYFSDSKDVLLRSNHLVGDKVVLEEEDKPMQYFIIDIGVLDENGMTKYTVGR